MALSEFHKEAKKTVRTACENALLDKGFVPDPVDENSDDDETDCESTPLLAL